MNLRLLIAWWTSPRLTTLRSSHRIWRYLKGWRSVAPGFVFRSFDSLDTYWWQIPLRSSETGGYYISCKDLTAAIRSVLKARLFCLKTWPCLVDENISLGYMPLAISSGPFFLPFFSIKSRHGPLLGDTVLTHVF